MRRLTAAVVTACILAALVPATAGARVRVRVGPPPPEIVGPLIAAGALGLLGVAEALEHGPSRDDRRTRTVPDRYGGDGDRRRDRDRDRYDRYDRYDPYRRDDRWDRHDRWGDRYWFDRWPFQQRDDGWVWVPGHWEWKRVWEPRGTVRTWVPGWRDDDGRWHRGHWERSTGAGRWVSRRVWEEGRWELRW